MAKPSFPVTGDPAADALLVSDPLALLVGMLLDQQVPMEWAFRGPKTLRDRLGSLDAGAIAAMEPDALEAVFKEKPALHRYPGSMARRTHALCAYVTREYGGDAGKLWRGVRDPAVLHDRIRELPGYGEEKARILLAILGKRLGRAPAGWERYAGPFADRQPRSVADIDSPESLARVREWKKAQKAAKKGKQD
ncbi:MAG: HhH-GPD-type base excision DNA repair protein [Acidimicrobiia bacterium]